MGLCELEYHAARGASADKIGVSWSQHYFTNLMDGIKQAKMKSSAEASLYLDGAGCPVLCVPSVIPKRFDKRLQMLEAGLEVFLIMAQATDAALEDRFRHRLINDAPQQLRLRVVVK